MRPKSFWIKAGLAGLLFSFIMASCSTRRNVAVENGWDLLGDRKVNFVRDIDNFEVNNSNLYTALRFRVEGRDIHVNDVKVFFANGDKLEPNVNENYMAGQNSRIIELGDQGRAISRIEFRYRTTGNVVKGRGEVFVFGRRY